MQDKYFVPCKCNFQGETQKPEKGHAQENENKLRIFISEFSFSILVNYRPSAQFYTVKIE